MARPFLGSALGLGQACSAFQHLEGGTTPLDPYLPDAVLVAASAAVVAAAAAAAVAAGVAAASAAACAAVLEACNAALASCLWSRKTISCSG